MGTTCGLKIDPLYRYVRALVICFILLPCIQLSLGAKTRHFKWEVEYKYWSPDCIENIVMAINGQFPGPTIRAKVGDTISVELTNKLSTEGVVIHWHGIRQVLLSLPSQFYIRNNFHSFFTIYELAGF